MKMSKKVRKSELARCEYLVATVEAANPDDRELPWLHAELLSIVKHSTSRKTRALALAHIDYDWAASVPRGPLAEAKPI